MSDETTSQLQDSLHRFTLKICRITPEIVEDLDNSQVIKIFGLDGIQHLYDCANCGCVIIVINRRFRVLTSKRGLIKVLIAFIAQQAQS
jgi:hypothetical protein